MPGLLKKKRVNKIKVLLADDQPEVRRALTTYLRRDGRFEIVGEAEDGEEAVKLVESHRPDIVVMDLAMPKMNGLLATKEITELFPDTKIVVLSSSVPFGGTGQSAVAVGAHAVFDKYTHPKKLIKAIVGVVEA